MKTKQRKPSPPTRTTVWCHVTRVRSKPYTIKAHVTKVPMEPYTVTMAVRDENDKTVSREKVTLYRERSTPSTRR